MNNNSLRFNKKMFLSIYIQLFIKMVSYCSLPCFYIVDFVLRHYNAFSFQNRNLLY